MLYNDRLSSALGQLSLQLRHLSKTPLNKYLQLKFCFINSIILRCLRPKTEVDSPNSVMHRDRIYCLKRNVTPTSSHPRPNSVIMKDRKDLLKELIVQRKERKEKSFKVSHRIERRILKIFEPRVPKVSGMKAIDGKQQRVKGVALVNTRNARLTFDPHNSLSCSRTIPKFESMPGQWTIESPKSATGSVDGLKREMVATKKYQNKFFGEKDILINHQ